MKLNDATKAIIESFIKAAEESGNTIVVMSVTDGITILTPLSKILADNKE